MLRRLGVATLVVGLLTAACGSAAPSQAPTETQAPLPTAEATGQQPTASQQPSTTDAPASTDQPPATGDPTASDGPSPSVAPLPDPNAALEPLPDPELETVDDIVEAMFQPGMAAVSVVSMLDQLGIGTYHDDGSPIHVGSETSDADVYLFESEVRGLIGMIEQQDRQPWLDFTQFHAGLAELGLQSSASDLAQAYNDAYAQQPDAPITRFVQATAFIDPQAQISPLGVWLMYLDGVVPDSTSTEAQALVGTWDLVAAGPRRSVAGSNVRNLNWASRPGASALADLRIMAVIATSSIFVEALPSSVHEGHGGNGSPADVKATVRPCGSGFSPFSGACQIPTGAGLAGIQVTWVLDGALTSHGTPSVASGSSTATDGSGAARFTYTPKPETPDASRDGYEISESSLIEAKVSKQQMINQLWGGRQALGTLLGNNPTVSGYARLEIKWHEPNALRIELLNPYDVTIRDLIYGGEATQKGTDTIKGDLVLDEDGVTYRGIMVGHAKGSFRGKFMGKSCSMSWDSTQLLQTVATVDPGSNEISFAFVPVDAPNGLPRGRCRPTMWKSDDSGVHFAPYNDYAVVTPNGLHFQLFPKPGGDADYPVPPGPSNVTIRNTLWHVHEEYLEHP